LYPKYLSGAYKNILEHKQIFDILEGIEKIASEYEMRSPEKTSEREDLGLIQYCANIIFTAAHLNFQSAVIQLEFGFALAATNQIRAIFELATDQKYLLRHDLSISFQLAQRFRDYERAYRHEFKNKAIPLFKDRKDANAESHEKAFKYFQEKYTGDLRHWTGKPLDKRLEDIGIKEDYMMYKVLSQGSHVSPLVWASFMKKLEDGIAFTSGPSHKNINVAGFQLAVIFCQLMLPLIEFQGRIGLRRRLLGLQGILWKFSESGEMEKGLS
jgi:hypothetical protein